MQKDKSDPNDPEYKESIGLIHVSNDEPGYSRRRCGRGFIYFDENLAKISDPEILDRIRNIGIPPVWEKVWICKSELGYLQATGMDMKNRKQYLYHEIWIEYQQHYKFRKIIKFANSTGYPEDNRSSPGQKGMAQGKGIGADDRNTR